MAKFATVLFILAASIFAAVYFLFFAGYLKVNDFSIDSDNDELVEDLRATTKEWLDKNILGLKWRDNLLFLSVRHLRDFLYARFPAIADLKITKKFPHGLNVSVKEKEHYGTWCLGTPVTHPDGRYGASQAPLRCYQFDLAGKAFKETLPSAGFLIFTILDYRPRSIEIGQPVAEDNWFSTLFLAREILLKYNIRPGEFVIPADSFDEFQVKTAEGWTILFSTSTDVAMQIDALAQLLREREKDKSAVRFEYLDLRVQDRIYFK